MKTLIVGCGDLGTRLGQLFLDRGVEVAAIRRNATRLPDSFTKFSFDISNAAAWDALNFQPEVVFFTAAAPERTALSYQSTYVDGVANLLSWLKKRQCSPKRIFFSSSTAVYGQTNGEWVSEDSQTLPTTFNGKLLLEAETLLNESEHPCCLVRLSGLYGPGRTYLISALKQGALYYQESPPRYTNRIEISDAARLMVHLFETKPLEACYLAVDNSPETEKAVYTWLAETLKLPAPGVKNLGSEQNKRCSNKRLLNTGFKFNCPSFREGYLELIRGNIHDN